MSLYIYKLSKRLASGSHTAWARDVFPGPQSPSRPVAERVRRGRRVRVRAVALQDDDVYNNSLRFEFLCFSCGRAQRTRVAHENARFARGAHRELGSRSRTDLRAREASRPSEAERRRGRA